MLTADQIDALSLRAEQISDSLSDFLISDIAERISEAGQLTGTASYEVWRLQNLGVSQDKLKKELKKRLNLSLSEVEDLLKQSAEAGYNFDISRFPTADAIPFAENTSLQQIVNAAVQMAQEDFSDIVQTIGFVGPDGGVRELTQAYQQACDYAFQKTVTGTQDMYSAIREATRNLAEKGIRFIDYESGVHTSMEAAVRRCVMGGMGLMQEKISQDNHDYLGCDGWEISAHHGCAPDHEPIQGKQYDDKTYQSINGSLQRRIGTLNCGHAAFPIILGVNSPQYSAAELEEMRKENEEGVTFEGRHYSLYDATQRQRKFERSIRKQKRRILIDEKTGDAEKLQADQIRLVRLQQEYARFSRGTGLRQQWERAESAGFSWKEGNTADRVTEKKFKEILEKAKNGDKIVLDDDMETIIAGKPFEKIQPLREKLSDRAARKWYLAQDAEIPNRIDLSLSIEEQARQACDMRNQNRTHARDLMRDQKKRKQLDRDDPNKTFEELIADKMKRKNLTREEAIKDILKTATKTRKQVNKQLGLE